MVSKPSREHGVQAIEGRSPPQTLSVGEDVEALALGKWAWSISAIVWHLGRDRKRWLFPARQRHTDLHGTTKASRDRPRHPQLATFPGPRQTQNFRSPRL